MTKIELLIGTIIGFIGTGIGCIVFLNFFTDYDLLQGLQIMKAQGAIGKLITLGSILDLLIFGILLQVNKEMMARGVVLSVIIMAVLTLFV